MGVRSGVYVTPLVALLTTAVSASAASFWPVRVRAAARLSAQGTLAFALGLGGCGGVLPSDEKLPPQVLVKYQRTGGIAGFEDEVTVERSGRAVFTAKLEPPKPVRLPARTMQRLEDALKRADFDNLKSSYGGNNYPDAIQSAITYRDKTVRGGDTPPELRPAESILLGLIDRELYDLPPSGPAGRP